MKIAQILLTKPASATFVRERQQPGYIKSLACQFSFPNGSLYCTILCKMFRKGLPHFAKGEVVKGFGRGSKDLGCPTANYPVEVVNSLPAVIETGVYFGFASVNKGDVHKMVMSIGWNPVFKNTTKSMEVHIMHKFEADFYGQELRIVMLGYLRPEKNFETLDELIKTIQADIAEASVKLEESQLKKYKTDKFFFD